MNCSNCGAPTVLVDGRGHFRCDFCSTFHFPESKSSDRVSVIGEEIGHDCPVCQCELSEGLMDKHPVAFCEACRGVLIRNQDFCDTMRDRRAASAKIHAAPTPLDVEELKRRIACPICTKRMNIHPYHGPGNVVIDSCSECHLIWFDHGEIAAIEIAPGVN